MELRRVTAADVDRASAADALDRVFANYVVPISFAEPAYTIHVEANDVAAASSPIWYDGEGSVVAAGLLGVRGKRGWVGGFGIAPAQRRRGLGKALLAQMVEQAWSLGLDSITLEVLVENAAARKTYAAGGFAPVRVLATFAVDARQVAPQAADAPYARAAPLLDDADQTPPCWQRESASLRRQPNLHAVGDGRAFCVFRHNGERAQLLKVRAASPDQFARLAASVVAQTGVARIELFNEPLDSPTAEAARDLAWTAANEVIEMRLERPRFAGRPPEAANAAS